MTDIQTEPKCTGIPEVRVCMTGSPVRQEQLSTGLRVSFMPLTPAYETEQPLMAAPGPVIT